MSVISFSHLCCSDLELWLQNCSAGYPSCRQRLL